MDIVRYEYPELVLDIDCGSGTYVRSLGRDIADSVGTAAVMSGLVRTGIGAFRLEDAVLPSVFLDNESIVEQFLPIEMGTGELPRVVLNEIEIARVKDGLSITDRFSLSKLPDGAREVAAFDEQGRLVAILVPGRGHDRLGWGPLRNFADLL